MNIRKLYLFPWITDKCNTFAVWWPWRNINTSLASIQTGNNLWRSSGCWYKPQHFRFLIPLSWCRSSGDDFYPLRQIWSWPLWWNHPSSCCTNNEIRSFQTRYCILILSENIPDWSYNGILSPFVRGYQYLSYIERYLSDYSGLMQAS